MARLKYLTSAQKDLRGILRYIAHESGSVVIAQQFVALLRQKCSQLADLPGHIGRPSADLRSDVRSFAFRGYVIVFRYVENRFEVINIIEGRRDIITLYGAAEE